MAKVLNFFRVIRNNWKKSTVAAAAVSYGVSYSKELYDTEQLMRQYCEDIQKYGDAPLSTKTKPRHVTVILNPAAKKRKAKKLFEKYCEPLLHLAGIAVTIIQTESGSHARNILMNLDTPTDAIVVAGGDGTISDVLTGLVRKYQADISLVKQCPIGILPLGEINTIANTLYKNDVEFAEVKKLVNATLSVIHEKTKLMDAFEVQATEDDSEEDIKPVYAMGSIEWGEWRNAQAIAKKYWYWGPLKKYVAYVFHGYRRSEDSHCDAIMKYTDPCPGCSRCYKKVDKKWWYAFIPRRNALLKETAVDYSKVTNENCGVFHEIPISTTELSIKSPNIDNISTPDSPKSLKVYAGPEEVGYMSFVSEGWQREKQEATLEQKILEAKNIELLPEQTNSNQVLYVDNEEYELKTIKIKLLPQSVRIFCPDVYS